MLAMVAALPNVARYMPGGLSGVAAALANGTDAGDVIGSLVANVALVIALGAVAWVAFQRQEL